VVDPERAPRLASDVRAIASSLLNCQVITGELLELSDEAKEIVQDLGTAINEAVEGSSRVVETIERLRAAGYELELTLRLEIGLRPHAPASEESGDEAAFDWTEEDKRALRRMKIRLDNKE